MVGLVASSYYRRPSFGKKGPKASTLTYHNKQGWVVEKVVMAAIKQALSHEFIDCGCRLMSAYLQVDGYKINHKKVYRIMKEQGLLKLQNWGKTQWIWAKIRQIQESSNPQAYGLRGDGHQASLDTQYG